MLWIALVVGLALTLRRGRRAEITSSHIVDVALYGLVAGIVAAHITSILLDLRYYLANPKEVFGLWTGLFSRSGGLRGLSFHGGLAGGVLATLLYCRKKRLSFLRLADLFSPALALGYAITRIGCFLNGCCYGIPTNLPWAVRFRVAPDSSVLTLPSHPTQLYAVVSNLIILWLLFLIEKRQRFTGQIFVSYLALYSVYRFLIEFLRRGVTAEIAFAGLTQAQVVSLLMLGVTIPIMVKGLLLKSGAVQQCRDAKRAHSGSKR